MFAARSSGGALSSSRYASSDSPTMSSGLIGFHCWLRYQDWIFDHSGGDLRGLDAVASQQIAFGKLLSPMHWTVTLPPYLAEAGG